MKYDAIIIGFGKGGKTLAGALAKKGQRVALIERSKKMYGGTCINVGCIPSKSLVTSAEEAARYADEPFSRRAEIYARAIDEKRRVTEFLRKKNYDKLNSLEKVDIFDGEGSFVSPHEVAVMSEKGAVLLESEKIFINTGSEPVLHETAGMSGNPIVYTSETLMDESKLPRELTIIGAGYISMEFASMYANFGSHVTVLDRGEDFLPREDRDVAQAIFDLQSALGVKILMGASVKRIEADAVVIELENAEMRIPANAVLIATGRKPNVAALKLENAGVQLTPRGAIKVDDKLRTDVPGIWAMGDAAGSPQFTFASLDDYRIVMSDLFGGERTALGRNMPYSVFMDTPLARAGLSEQEAAARGLDYRVVKLATAAVPKAQVLKKTGGFLKTIIDNKTDLILGATLLCPEANEMINLLKLAMDMGVTYDGLRDRVYTHPTMTEAFNDLFAL